MLNFHIDVVHLAVGLLSAGEFAPWAKEGGGVIGEKLVGSAVDGEVTPGSRLYSLGY